MTVAGSLRRLRGVVGGVSNSWNVAELLEVAAVALVAVAVLGWVLGGAHRGGRWEVTGRDVALAVAGGWFVDSMVAWVMAAGVYAQVG